MVDHPYRCLDRCGKDRIVLVAFGGSEEKYLFQGDLFYFNNEATFPAKNRMTVMPFFAKWLKTNKLSPERIYGFHSPMFGTMEHIEKILKLSARENLVIN